MKTSKSFPKKTGAVFILLVGFALLLCVSTTDQLLYHEYGSRRASLAVTNVHVEDPQRICTQNPYMNALEETPNLIRARSNLWLAELPMHLIEAEKPEYKKHNHARFFPFEASMASCQKTDCVGGPCLRDESKIVCGLDGLNKPEEHQMIRGNAINESPCIIYSVGGNNQWKFELDLLEKTECEIHTFDCTGPIDRFDKKPDNPRVHFHHICIGIEHEDAPEVCEGGTPGDQPKCGPTWTLLEIQRHLQHSRIDLFKMDIEGFEWGLFESWPLLTDADSSDVLLPMQILVEIHYQTQFEVLFRQSGKGCKRCDFKFARDAVNLQKRLLEMGYIVVERDNNKRCAHCTELTLVRTQCPSSGAYAKNAFAASVS